MIDIAAMALSVTREDAEHAPGDVLLGLDIGALALADRRDDVEHALGYVLLVLDVALELERLFRMQRRQVLEQDLVLRRLGELAVDLVDLDQREVALAVLGRADLALD